jgi:hypothetical protein
MQRAVAPQRLEAENRALSERLEKALASTKAAVATQGQQSAAQQKEVAAVSLEAVNKLKAQLVAAEQRLQSMERLREQTQAVHQREERLMMSAFYDFGKDRARGHLLKAGGGGANLFTDAAAGGSAGVPPVAWLGRKRLEKVAAAT